MSLAPNPTAELYRRALFGFVAQTRNIMPGAPMEARAARAAADAVGCTVVNDKKPLVIGGQVSINIPIETFADIFAASMTLLIGGATPEEQSRFVGRLIAMLLGQLATDPAHPLHQDYLETLPPKEDANGPAASDDANKIN